MAAANINLDTAEEVTSSTSSNCTCNPSNLPNEKEKSMKVSSTEESVASLSETCSCEEVESSPEEISSEEEAIPAHATRPPRAADMRKSEDEKKPKLRTSKDVYDRLKWDSLSVTIKSKEGVEDDLDLSLVYVGYKDRFLGMCELPFEQFQPGGDIPFHRVYYFRTGGAPVDPFVGKDGEVKVGEHNLPPHSVFIWDRDSRTDLVFKSGNTTYTKSI